MEQSIYNKHLILSMIKLIEGYKEIEKLHPKAIEPKSGGRNYWKDCTDSLKYLLNQTVRQFHLDSTHFKVSKEAQQCWDEIVINGQRIENYFNGEMVECKAVEHPEDYPRYIGASKHGVSTCIRNEKGRYYFKFNDLFHCEHIIPVNQIVAALLKLDNPSELSVNEVLSKIYICKMLKREDRRIKEKSHRGDNLDYLRIINSVYREANIEVIM